eukprot:CAMPEP_0204525388 /NCGR_PEP_ID=MMETSP0661-20131031/7882_1 /ASSEMBLY_ACC=CAM_ASM_000606 /TAXON_ID=109239 /ORGANISM="Alexandrium margalefi, Strain AMGDE01CS-322" /LENGTH=349 /DNA_ID=CAMNT_0051531183 /DNA_START=16 /DNA_END=1065 /DNA_ORIENTATION=+
MAAGLQPDLGFGSFCGAPLNRATGAEHKDAAWTKAALENPESRFLIFSTQKGSTGAAPLLGKQRPLLPVVAWQRGAVFEALGVSLEGHSCNGVPPIFLGAQGDAQHFAVLVDKGEEELKGACDVPEGRSLFVSDGMMKLMMIGCDAGDLTTVGQAFSRITWHKTVLHCGSCGKPTAPCDSGTKRKCTACKARFYPRIDPSCMALVRKASDDACLLVRNKGWPAGMWSCLSGYVEQGEQVEETIRREVFEETRLQVDLSRGVDWLGTQPWPLGPGGKSELMLAAEVVAASEEVKPNEAELEDARWFGREEVGAMLQTPWNTEGRPFVPGESSAAHHLLRRWFHRAAGATS